MIVNDCVNSCWDMLFTVVIRDYRAFVAVATRGGTRRTLVEHHRHIPRCSVRAVREICCRDSAFLFLATRAAVCFILFFIFVYLLYHPRGLTLLTLVLRVFLVLRVSLVRRVSFLAIIFPDRRRCNTSCSSRPHQPIPSAGQVRRFIVSARSPLSSSPHRLVRYLLPPPACSSQLFTSTSSAPRSLQISILYHYGCCKHANDGRQSSPLRLYP